MEILGIVWAASIICPASAAGKSTQGICVPHTLQHESLLSAKPADWMRSLPRLSGLIPAGDWALNTEGAEPSPWVLETLESVATLTTQETSFETLVPSIGVGLTSFQPADASSTVAVSQSIQSEESLFDGKWHSWSAVAAVRSEPSAAQSSTDLPEFAPDYCLQDASATYQPSPLAIKASPKYQVWLHNQFIGEVAGQVAVEKISAKLRALVQSGTLRPSQLTPLVGPDFIGVAHDNDLLFVVNETLQPHPEVPAAVTAVQWVNNLRGALNVTPMGLAEVQMVLDGLTETSEVLYGTASWYGPYFHGRQTANGEIFDENELTAAHKTLPFNTRLKVTNRMNERSVVVRINDRGPYIGQRSLDLSKAAARCLGSTQDGVVPYEAVILEPATQPDLGEFTTAQRTLD